MKQRQKQGMYIIVQVSQKCGNSADSKGSILSLLLTDQAALLLHYQGINWAVAGRLKGNSSMGRTSGKGRNEIIKVNQKWSTYNDFLLNVSFLVYKLIMLQFWSYKFKERKWVGKSDLSPMFCFLSILDTTRSKKSHEKEGVEYNFVSKQSFETDVQQNKWVNFKILT